MCAECGVEGHALEPVALERVERVGKHARGGVHNTVGSIAEVIVHLRLKKRGGGWLSKK